MLSRKLEHLAEMVDGLGVAEDDRVAKAFIIGALNTLAADAHALEACIVPMHARRHPLAEGGNIVSLARCRAERALGVD
jgi:Ran GTPase-activating protein (RanGAP) involved in mRNA processing and transport